MKKIMFLLMFIFIGLTTVNAQKGQDRKEKIKELRKAFFQENLNLTEAESAKFWPMYEKHRTEKRDLRKTMKDMKGKIAENESLTDAEFITFIDETSDLRIQEIALDKQYTKDVLSVLGLERTMKIKPLEKEFKQQLKEKRREGKGEHKHKGDRIPNHDH